MQKIFNLRQGGFAVIYPTSVQTIDPRNIAAGGIADLYKAYPCTGSVLPAMGYSAPHLDALGKTINTAGAEVVVSATPCDLSKLIDLPPHRPSAL